MTGSPTKPNDIIEKWVSDSHNYTWKLSLLKKKYVNIQLFSSGRKVAEQLEVNDTMIVLNVIIKENAGRWVPLNSFFTSITSMFLCFFMSVIRKLRLTYKSVIFQRNMEQYNGLMVSIYLIWITR